MANGEKCDILSRKTPKKGVDVLKLKDFETEDEFSPEAFSDLIEDEEAPYFPAPGRVRPEAIMAIIAVVAAVILVLVVVLCLPLMKQELQAAASEATQTQTEAPAVDEDPMAVHQHSGEEEVLPTIEPIIEPEKNPYGPMDFQYDHQNYLYCLRQDSYPGVDVSAFQGDIDWVKVKQSGIRFAMLRVGYRGYESGKLVEDEYIRQNLENTAAAGMPIGAYFFSQALTIKEVDEEIAFMLDILGDRQLEMPIVLDWEIPTDTARTAQMDARTLTALQEYFCKTMAEKGYTPMIYFNWHQSNTLLYLNELESYPFWLALYQDRMTYPYHVEMWQYTASGRVPGITGDVDINVYMPPQ